MPTANQLARSLCGGQSVRATQTVEFPADYQRDKNSLGCGDGSDLAMLASASPALDLRMLAINENLNFEARADTYLSAG